MKHSRIWKVVSCLSVVFASQNVNADNFYRFTKESESGISKYAVTCYDDGRGAPYEYQFRVTPTKSPIQVGIKLTVNKVEQANEVTVDALKSGSSSPWGSNLGGGGVYVLTVTKIKTGASAVGRVGFAIDHHCMSTSNHTGTSEPKDISPVDPPGPVNPGPVDPPKTPAPGFSAALNNKVEARRYTVECMAKRGVDTQRYRFRIRGVSKTAPFNARMTVSIDGSEGVEAVDPINTDTNFSEWQEIFGGNNIYHLTVDKVSATDNTKGRLPFRIQHECVSETDRRTRLKGPLKQP